MTSPDASAYDKLEAVGAWTAPFLAGHPEAERDLAARFRARGWKGGAAAVALNGGSAGRRR
ncbi:MAG: hypothetical protein U0529_08885 [Thermoanaerobaculia bacterium]